MDSEFEIATDGTPAAAPGVEPSAAVAPATSPAGVDARLAGILAKQASGQTLTLSERGYLGSVKRKGLAGVATPASKNPLLKPAGNPDNPLFAGQTQSQAPADSEPLPAVDSALIRATADAVLSSCDLFTKIWIGAEARRAGLAKEVVDEYKAAVALQEDNRKLIVENSEPAIVWTCEKIGCAPATLTAALKNSGLVAGIAAHVSGVVSALKQIKEHAASQPQPAGEGK